MGVRRLTEADRERTLSFLERESSLNLFIIGDIYNFGFKTDFQELWGDFDGTERLRAVLLRYHGNWIPCAAGDFDVEGFASVIREGKKVEMIHGIDRVIERFRKVSGLPFRWDRMRHTHFAELTDPKKLTEPAQSGTLSIRRMELPDVSALVALSRAIGEFTRPYREEELRQWLQSGDSRGYWVEEAGRAVAMARTTAENPASAMVVGVGTLPSHRRRGLATRLMGRLCREVLAEGKTLCLFYDNPRAGAIYRRLGFREIGFWNMVPV
ncbi:hypothetical protein C8P63_11280 [Melghirimyces profundicolus]|uniref:N-acetyltransferase domain-containing protein n=1 Tax=Melghirimyces profundicolus TaxID=1242148 RepID=A0A2T6BTJ5_9BACL|nr:GNAT family N-acetyltransferase [Melghirimyces profundicolus]PTX59384.1 hypothetical protein C8P63_11280 [Melghirimyces profundicolus]